MSSKLLKELKSQIVTINQIVRTREFWIYVAVIFMLLCIALAGLWVAAGFDPLTRGQLRMAMSCRTGEGQLATIIIGGFVFALACLFTLGEVIHWVEETRMSRAPGRIPYRVSVLRPILHIVGTMIVGVGGFLLMRTWCA
ncbi:hypothetical protein [Propionivibrio limicola]|uniref:hypothetical protein n=1 Tax=Propionivibrio limicola TaxID=167645 RepID=UPI00129236ED|nr:hypothetical protein [Propionivibrio limicola]